MKKGDVVDTRKVIRLAASSVTFSGEGYHQLFRYRVKSKYEKIFGNDYIITGRKKHGTDEYFIEGFDDHDKCSDALKKMLKNPIKSIEDFDPTNQISP